MDEKKYIKEIKKMTFRELFEEIISHPEYLVDQKYERISVVIYKRYDKLLKKEIKNERKNSKTN